MVQLLRWGAETGLEEAMRELFSPEFDPSTAPIDDPSVGKVLAFGETLGTFVKHDLLDAELVADLLWIEGLWAKVSHHALAVRDEEHEPRMYENFEALAVSTGMAATR
jgi:hypothetical protein